MFWALAVTSIWMMPLGSVAARAAHSDDPGAMLAAVGLGASGALLLAVATVTTNFVNIYMSSLAWKSLTPRSSDAAVVWFIGVVGTALGAMPGVWLEHYTNFVVVLGGVLVPIGGVLLAHYYLVPAGAPDEAVIAAMYQRGGPFRGASVPGTAAWAAGAAAFFVASRSPVGGTIPALAASLLVYVAVARGRLFVNRRAGLAADRASLRVAPAPDRRESP